MPVGLALGGIHRPIAPAPDHHGKAGRVTLTRGPRESGEERVRAVHAHDVRAREFRSAKQSGHHGPG